MKAILVILTLFFSYAMSASAGTDIEKIDTKLSTYPWYKEVAEITGRNHGGSKSYNARVQAVSYLNSVGKFTPPDAQYCNNADSVKEYSMNMCYIGATNQNKALLQALSTKSVQDALKKTSPWVIINGSDGKLNSYSHLIASFQKLCDQGYKKACEDIPYKKIREKDLFSARR